MGNEAVLTGWAPVSRVLTTTRGPSAVPISAPRLVSVVCVAAGEEVIPWETGLVEESVVVKAETDEGRLLAIVAVVASPRPDSVLENGLNEKAAELAPRTPGVAKEAMASDRGVNVSSGMASAEDRIPVLK